MKKATVLFLVLISLISSTVLASCQSDPSTKIIETSGGYSTGDGTTAPSLDILPKRDFDEYVFTILYRDSENLVSDMSYDETSGDVLEVAKFRRNKAIEERYNIKINAISLTGDIAGDRAMSSLQAGENQYDVILPHAHFTWAYIFNGLALEWNENMTYCDLDAPWWDQDARENFTIGGKLYTMIGDFSTFTLGQTVGMVFNKKLFADLQLENPYDKVKNGTWTFDELYSCVKAGALDVNNDGKFDLEKDRFGYLTTVFGGTIGFLWSSGSRTTAKDDSGMPYITLNNERTVDLFDKFFSMMRENGNKILDEASFDTSIREFQASRVLIIDLLMRQIMNLGGMDDDFGILPYPKFTADVENYASNVDAGMHLTIIPYTTENPERTSIILEALSIEGYNTVIPAFYEKSLQHRAARDPIDIEMLDLIRSTRVFDFGYYTNFNTAIGLPGFYLSKNPKETFTVLYEKNSSTATVNLEDFLDKYTSLE